MTDLEQMAASVAKALGAHDISTHSEFRGYQDLHEGISHRLYASGSNLFDPYWQTRCRDWLKENGMWVTIAPDISKPILHLAQSHFDTHDSVALDCPAAKFCARAIHELMREGKS